METIVCVLITMLVIGWMVTSCFLKKRPVAGHISFLTYTEMQWGRIKLPYRWEGKWMDFRNYSPEFELWARPDDDTWDTWDDDDTWDNDDSAGDDDPWTDPCGALERPLCTKCGALDEFCSCGNQNEDENEPGFRPLGVDTYFYRNRGVHDARYKNFRSTRRGKDIRSAGQ